MDKNAKIFISVIIILIVGVITLMFLRSKTSTEIVEAGKYDQFAACLKEKGAVFYGAFWCPHCQKQKKLFGSSAKLLPYVECSTADASSQIQICKDKKVESYPTWEFRDSSRITGEVTLEELAQKTGCVLPALDANQPLSGGTNNTTQ